MDHVTSRDRQSGSAVPKPINAALRLFLIAASGTFIVLGMQLIPSFSSAPTRPSVLQPASIPEGPDVVGQMSRLQHLLTGPYVILPRFLVIVYLAISRRDQPTSW